MTVDDTESKYLSKYWHMIFQKKLEMDKQMVLLFNCKRRSFHWKISI